MNMEYTVIFSASTKDLVNDVNRYIANGWQLYGNLVVSDKGGLYQALIRIKE